VSFHFPVSRRDFVRSTVASGVLALTPGWGSCAEADVDADTWILLSDTHIAADRNLVAHDANMSDNLKLAIDQLLELPTNPAGVMINGDCAYLKGLPEDYRTLAPHIERLTTAGIPVHLTMGNHDDRGPARAEFADQFAASPVEGKHVAVIQSEFANWFLIDSLLEVNQVAGEIGELQRKWLAKALDEHQDKPAIVVGHHYLQNSIATANPKEVTGLKDTTEMIELFHVKPQVKAFIFGHSHNWSLGKTSASVHLVNLPPVAYLFDRSRPNGWVQAVVKPDRLELTLHAFDKQHAESGKTHALEWR